MDMKRIFDELFHDTRYGLRLIIRSPGFALVGVLVLGVGIGATAAILPLLRTRMAIGRPFTTEEDRPGANPVAVLTNGFWRSHFGANPNVIGQQIRIDGNSATVIGVLAADPEYFGLARVWTPLALGREPNGRSAHFLSAVARLKSGMRL